MNCPKCGHVQEERLDCLKCGIVFTKYSELHFPEKPQRPESAPPLASRNPAAHVPEELSPGEVAELRQTVRELNRRFSELEFERVDRNQLWKELRTLEQKVNTGLKESSLRLDDCEARMQSIPETPLDLLKEQLWEEDLKPLLEKIEELEAGLEKIAAAHSAQSAMRTAETLGRLESRVLEVERVAANAVKKVDAGSSDTEKARAELQALRTRLEAVAPDKCAQLGTELADLRSEVRQSFEQLAVIESRRSEQQSGAARNDLSSVADRLSILSTGVQSLAEELSRTAAAVRETREEAGDSALRLQGIETAVNAMEAESDRVRVRVESLEQLLGSRKAGPGSQPLREDVHSIRDNLDQIRDFMNELARKR